MFTAVASFLIPGTWFRSVDVWLRCFQVPIKMRFTVIIPVYNTATHLRQCLAALLALDSPKDEYEILMVENNSTDMSPKILRSAVGIRALHEAKQGSYAARNRALREARGEFLAFTDSDCIPDPGWLRAIEKSFEDPQVQVFLGPGGRRTTWD